LLASLLRSPPRSPHFPYTTLFRSVCCLPNISKDRFPKVIRLASIYCLAWVSCRESSCKLPIRPEWCGFSWTFLSEVSGAFLWRRSEEHTSELQSRENLVCRLLLEK